MGFQKGSITLSPTQDIPLLLQVLHSRFITHEQLLEFMMLGCYELKRNSFNWRVRRLVRSGLLNRHCVRPVTPSPVYSITNIAAFMLAEHCPILEMGNQREAAELQFRIAHSIGLNDLHLSLMRQGVLQDWQSEVAIRATNELTSSGYVKDYDAVVTVRVDGQSFKFALEYERTAKKPKDYFRIRSLLEHEYRLRHFVYVVPDYKLASFILECFMGTTAALVIGLANDFARSFKDMSVTKCDAGLTVPITAALRSPDEFAVTPPRLPRDSSLL